MRKPIKSKAFEQALAKITERYGEQLVEVKAKTTKYRVFSRPSAAEFVFIGRNGAVRVGKSITDSISLTDSLK